MNFWFNGNSDIRSMEDKSVRQLAEDKMKKRIAMESEIGFKKSVLMMLSGVFFGIIFSVFEYILKNIDLGVVLNSLLKVGMFLTLAGSLLFIFGMYYFIKSFRR
ncbi:MAG: hypothetical protein IBX70_10375 [Clostridia bacterium]|nr:hypothetical protein [Clostridia bacterium]